ncbi:hypothetical protein LLG95_03185 [bacterium]|nr:hypothetical protein [bacterium]
MNSARWTLLMFAILLASGCKEWSKPTVADDQRDRRVVVSLIDEQAAQAIQRQRAIYPFYFITGTAELNDLGRRDLIVLADIQRQSPGVVHVYRDREAPGLHAARLRAIREFFENEGVPVGRVRFDEGWPGGDGEGAEAVVHTLMKPEMEPVTVGIAGAPMALPQSGDTNNKPY